MANVKATMTDLKLLLRGLKKNQSQRSLSKQLGISRSSIKMYVDRIKSAGLSLDAIEQLDDKELHALLRRPNREYLPDERRKRFDAIVPELALKLGKARYKNYELLWEQYCKDAAEENPYGYTQFKHIIQEYLKSQDYVYHNVYEPGFQLQVDFAGDKLYYIKNAKTGEKQAVYVLCCCLPATSFSFVYAMTDTTMEKFYHGMSKCLEYLGGVPVQVKSDNMAQYVKRYDRYEPAMTEAATQWGYHYDTELINTRVRKPRDKGAVEGFVYKAYQRMYAQMEDEVYYSLEEINARLYDLLEEYNHTRFKKDFPSRYERFIELEKETLYPLPQSPFVFKYSKTVNISSNYHVVVGKEQHMYSVPYKYVNQKAKVVYDIEAVEVYVNFERIATHKRSYVARGYTTVVEHMPPNHQAYKRSQEYNAAYFLEQAAYAGEATKQIVQRILSGKSFVQQSYNSCQGILSLKRKYGSERLEAACMRIIDAPTVNYSMVRNILEKGLDMQEESALYKSLPEHDNIRGAAHYQ
ncbi:MAG TPA: IS21 family transposase [Bacteroidaceae bacterium]|nr:IS21 family transposase [Bacteroidaceae bacterium]